MATFIKVKDTIYKVKAKDEEYYYADELQIRKEYTLDKNEYLKQFDEKVIGIEKYGIGKHPIYNYKIYSHKLDHRKLKVKVKHDEVDTIINSLQNTYLVNDKLVVDYRMYNNLLYKFEDEIVTRYDILCTLILFNEKHFIKEKLRDIKDFLSNDYLFDIYIKHDDEILKLYNKIKKYKTKIKGVRNVECPCCYENKKVKINRYQCEHPICDSCYSNWKSNTCPTCRKYKNNISNFEEYLECCEINQANKCF